VRNSNIDPNNASAMRQDKVMAVRDCDEKRRNEAAGLSPRPVQERP
jgi:hypothetical protein